MRTVVIGAGIAGLATATLLAREGHRVTLVERTGEVGGRAGSLAVDGFRWDTGPSWYLMPEAFDRFFAAAGTSTAEQLDLVRLDPSYRVYPEGADPVDVPAGREAAAALFDALEPGGGAALRRYLDSGRLAYTVAVRRFLYTTFSSPRPFLHRDVLGHVGLLLRLLLTPLDRWAAGFVRDRRLRQILTYNAVFLASRPSATPALYHLLSHADMDQGVFYPRGGFAAVVDALHGLARDAGVEILTDTEVTSVDVADGRVTGVTTSAGRIPAGTVVSSADLHHTETALLAPGQRTWPERRWRHRDPGPGAVVVMLGVRGGCRSWRTTPCSSAGTGTRTSGRCSRGGARRVVAVGVRLAAVGDGPDGRPPPGTRTSSSSSRCRRTRRRGTVTPTPRRSRRRWGGSPTPRCALSRGAPG